jgi:drug/metabolite transporter (DMT)-like permease
MLLSRHMRAGVIAAYAGMCLIWGTTWLGIKISLETLGPLMGVGLRFTIAGLFLFAIAAWRRELRPLREYPWRVIVILSAFLFATNYVLNYVAETRLDSGLVSVLFGMLPFFTFGFGALMIGERATPAVWAGATIAFIGLAVVSLTPQVRGSIPYALCTIAAAAIAAFANVYAKKHSHHHPLVTLPPAMLMAGLEVMALGLIFERTNWHNATSVPSIAAVLYLAILGSSIAFFLMLWLLQRIPAYAIGIASLIFPIVALAVGALFGGEIPGPKELAGCALVIGGMGIALARPAASVETRSDTA